MKRLLDTSNFAEIYPEIDPNKRVTFHWFGDIDLPVRVSGSTNAKFPASEMPWPLVQLRFDALKYEYIFIRKGSSTAWLYRLDEGLANFVDRIKALSCRLFQINKLT